MRQRAFESLHLVRWEQFAAKLKRLESRHLGRGFAEDAEAAEFLAAYRSLCRDLSIAKGRMYSPALISYLNELVVRGHNLIYLRRSSFLRDMLAFVTLEFPLLVRQQWAFMLVACVLFLLPGLLFVLAMRQSPEVLYSLMSPDQVASMEAMYDPDASHWGRERGSDNDFMMFGYYIYNNIGISFQLYATGLLAGLGTLFYLIYNSLILGAVTYHLTHIGYGSTFYSFVIGHGAFELTAIVISGGAGLRLAYALLRPGPLPRRQALVQAAGLTIRIMIGCILMLVLAAFVEAFWSGKRWPGDLSKYLVGGICWLLVFYYFLFAGRVRGSQSA